MRKFIACVIAFIAIFVPAGLLLQHWGGFRNELATVVVTAFTLFVYLIVFNKIRNS
jgi:hypothetical protein